jgi:hypothetical protein
MSAPKTEVVFDLVKNSSLYREYLAEREEILRHKWIESEKAGKDIGFERALLDWIIKYRSAWRDDRGRQPRQPSDASTPTEPKAEESQ